MAWRDDDDDDDGPAIVTEAEGAGRQSGGWWAAVFALVVVVLCLMAAGGWLGYHWGYRQWASELDRRPPVAILDVSRVAAEDEETDQRVTVLRQQAKRLAAAGYVVLDGRGVLAAPADLYVPVE
jgi:hypothetical protein